MTSRKRYKKVVLPRSKSLISLAAWIPSSLRFFSICLLRARAARSSADEAQPMAMARTAWLATRGSAVLLACSRPVVARRSRRARAQSRTRASGLFGRAPASRHPDMTSKWSVQLWTHVSWCTEFDYLGTRITVQYSRGEASTWARVRMASCAALSRRQHCASSALDSSSQSSPGHTRCPYYWYTLLDPTIKQCICTYKYMYCNFYFN